MVTPSWALGVPLVYLLLFPERNGAFGARQIRLPNLDREEPEKDMFRANELYAKGCDGGNAIGCRNLALSYKYGKGKVTDVARALKLLRKACELGNKKACKEVD